METAPSSTAAHSPTEFQPFVPASTVMPELTFRAVIIGALLGIVFAASSVYLGLKVGLTVSASVPVAVLSITLFRWLGKRLRARPATILENNIVQTTGSAGESIAAGIAFTLPSLLLMGFEMELMRVLLVGLLGGLIGVLMMIPLRHGLMVKEHGKLKFPEGTACADVLIVGEQGGMSAKTLFLGFGVGFGYAFLNQIVGLWKENAEFAANMWGKLKGAVLQFEVTPTMLGVGYIIGPRVAANMLAGGALAFLVLIPLIHFFGDGLQAAIYPASTKLISKMGWHEIRNNYILFIGAGAVATGGFIALARAIPTIVQAFRRGISNLGDRKAEAAAAAAAPSGLPATLPLPRTERDLSMRIVLGGSLALALGIALAPVLDVNVVSSLLIVLFGFFFVTVSSRITGEIGSSSNPISGMTVATLLLTCGLFVAIGWTGVEFKAMALTTAALVCVAASNGGTIAQDLKTGYLVGATPRHQQVSILVGVITSAIVIGFVLQLMNQGSTTYKAVAFPGFTVAAAKADPAHGTHVSTTDERMKGPNGVDYGVVYLHEAIPAGPVGADGKAPSVDRGKYLVDGEGKLAFLVDPGVCGTYPYTLEKPEKPIQVPVQSYADRELGYDHVDYAVVEVKFPRLPAGTYLVDSEGFARQRVSAGPDGKDAFEEVTFSGIVVPVPADAPTETVKGEDGKDQTFRRVRLAAAIDSKVTPGRYLATAAGQVAWISREETKFDAPKAQLFRLIIDGTLGGNLPWGLVLVGVFLAIMMELVGVQSLPFAVGLYLPIGTSAAIFVGGLMRWGVDRARKDSAAEAELSPGMLMASGLIAGGAIAGVVAQALTLSGTSLNVHESMERAAQLDPENASGLLSLLGSDWWAFALFLGLAALLYFVGARKKAA